MRTFSERESEGIRMALRRADGDTGLRFSAYVGRADGPSRAFAKRLHSALGEEVGAGVLIFVDPQACVLEIVTGEDARRRLPDADCRHAAVSIATACGIGDLAGGITRGVHLMAERAGRRAVESRA